MSEGEGRARQPRLHQAAGERHPFANAVAIVALNKDNTVIAFGSPFVQVSTVADSKPTVAAADAIATAEKQLNPPGQEDNTAALVHTFQVRNEAAGTWFAAFVDTHSGELVSVTDFVGKASYYVLPIWKEYPTDGFETLTGPQDPSGTAGNAVYLHLCVDALALQPCDPTFVGARDACIQADANRCGYGGANKCLLWNALASRGLGVKAANFDDDSSVPGGC